MVRQKTVLDFRHTTTVAKVRHGESFCLTTFLSNLNNERIRIPATLGTTRSTPGNRWKTTVPYDLAGAICRARR